MNNQIDNTIRARDALRTALAERDRARAARDEAAASLGRADVMLAESSAEATKLAKTRDQAEAAHAREIAGHIRRNHAPVIAPPETVKRAQQSLSEAESKRRMAQAARDQIAAELADADLKARDADAKVQSTALAVVVAAAQPLAEELKATLARLIELSDAVAGFGMIGVHLSGTARHAMPPLPPALGTAIFDVRKLGAALAPFRPARVILSATPEAVAAGRWRDFIKALSENPNVKFEDISAPELPPRSVSRHDQIPVDKISAASKIGSEAA